MLLGDLTKLIFLRRSDFRDRDVSTATLSGLTLLCVAGYSA